MTNHSNEQKTWKELLAVSFEQNQRYKYTRNATGEICRHALRNSSDVKKLTKLDFRNLVNNKFKFLNKKREEMLLIGDMPNSESISQYILNDLITDRTETYRQSDAFKITAEHKKEIDHYFRFKTTRIHERRYGKVFIHPQVYGSGHPEEMKQRDIHIKVDHIFKYLIKKLEKKLITGPLPKRPTIKNYIINECKFSYSERVRAVQASTASQAGPSSAPRPRSPQADSVPLNNDRINQVYKNMGSNAERDLNFLSSVLQQMGDGSSSSHPPAKRRRR